TQRMRRGREFPRSAPSPFMLVTASISLLLDQPASDGAADSLLLRKLHDCDGELPALISSGLSPSRKIRCHISRLINNHSRSPWLLMPCRCSSANLRTSFSSKCPRFKARPPSTNSSTTDQ